MDWQSLIDENGNVVVPSDITEIDDNAFLNCRELASILIPDSVKWIGNSAFCGCDRLSHIEISEGLKVIDNKAFKGCIGLANITIPSSVTRIGIEALYGCTGLSKINIPKGVKKIGERAFSGCSGLTSIVVERGNSSYRSEGNCLLTTDCHFGDYGNLLYDEGSLYHQDLILIAGCNNSVIPDGVFRICPWAFYGCRGLVSIDIPNSVKIIGMEAFRGTGLTSINIPNSVVMIDDYAFAECNNLAKIIVAQDNPVFCSEGNCLLKNGILVAECKNT